MSSAADEDAERRQREINMFAAFATASDVGAVVDPSHYLATTTAAAAAATSGGGGGGGSLLNSNDNTSSNAAHGNINNNSSQINNKIINNSGDDDDMMLLQPFAAATPQVEDSGTFAIMASSPHNAHATAERSNLEAAVAALTAGDADGTTHHHRHHHHHYQQQQQQAPWKPKLPLHYPRRSPRKLQMTPTQPMYTEEVWLPRPLFFGPILPPRLLKQSRKIVFDALQYQGWDGREETLPPKSSLPPDVRNLISTIDTFGYGLSVFPPPNTNNYSLLMLDHDKFWRGTEYVTTYQPVLGDLARAERHDRRRKRRKRGHSSSGGSKRSRSGSSNLSIPPLNGEDIIDKEMEGASDTKPSEDIPTTTAMATAAMTETMTTTATTTTTSATTSSNAPDRDLFLMWARGEGGIGASSSLDSNNDGMLRKKPPLGGTAASSGSGTTGRKPAQEPQQQPLVKTVFKDDESDTSIDEAAAKPLSEKDLFSRWARGEGTLPRTGTTTHPAHHHQQQQHHHHGNSQGESVPFFESDTFLPLHHRSVSKEDNDSDSVVGSELKKKVGISEHLNAALASLAAEDAHASNSDAVVSGSLTGEESEALLAQLPVATLGGRPLSNLELTNGCVPLFGADDPPLPTEADLGIYETKEEQSRSTQQRRSQEIIDKFVSPSIFGSVACPNPAVNPEDNHSWNSRAATSPRLLEAVAKRVSANRSGSISAAPPPPPQVQAEMTTTSTSDASETGANPPMQQQQQQQSPSGPATPSMRNGPPSGSRKNDPPSVLLRDGKRRYSNISRVGWWNASDTDDDDDDDFGADSNDEGRDGGGETPLQLSPIEHASYSLHVKTGLRPTPKKLREENLPLSLLHSATSTAEVLPFLSDRPPSARYVQIDARAVGFPPLGGEIEPLFCSLSIYHVESDGNSSNPAPNMQKCGRITETLNFDVVSDPDVEQRCSGSLWPYAAAPGETKDDSSFLRGASDDATYLSSLPYNERTQCSRCGVFPIPSNFNVANLYAVLIVQKVLSSDSDVDVYLKAGKGSDGKEVVPKSVDAESSSPAENIVDLEKFKTRAEKASSRRSHFLVPFAFGVAPLLQVFGTENPTSACSRAVQIPLFHFFAGSGDRQIIDHIMVMLYPRAEYSHSGIHVTNGGTAMLVMRNFGYLGLHCVVSNKSSLARDRLVDFTGELQIRRKNELDALEEELDGGQNRPLSNDDGVYVVPPWRPTFVTEPALNGGRNSIEPSSVDMTTDSTPSANPILDPGNILLLPTDSSSLQLYAQELAPVPLQLSSSTGRALSSPPLPGVHRFNRPQASYVEPTFHTSFCNELLCHPRLLHNCPQGHLAVKVELRELEWREDINAYLVHLPRSGPSIHNKRRGPFLVQGCFSSCSVRSNPAHFMDEFKIKLPLILQYGEIGYSARLPCLFFSVYDAKGGHKSKSRRRNAPSTSNNAKQALLSETLSDNEPVRDDGNDNSRWRPSLVSCGFLPLTVNSCLIGNGLHDVAMAHLATEPSREICLKLNISPDTIILTEQIEEAAEPSKDIAEQIEEAAEPSKDIASSQSTGSWQDGKAHGRGSTSDYSITDTESAAVGEATVETQSSRPDDLLGSVSFETTTARKFGFTKSRFHNDQMELQVRIVVHSSLHAQNSTVSELLRQDPDPKPVLLSDWTKLTIPMATTREELLYHLSHMNVSATGRLASTNEERLFQLTVDISSPAMNHGSDMSSHILRIASHLWKTMIVGTGEHDLLWANPASSLPIRIQSFASFIQLISFVSTFMTKHGMSQLNGLSRFNVGLLGRVVATWFDEGGIFGSKSKERFDFQSIFHLEPPARPDAASSSSSSDTQVKHVNPDVPKEKRNRHVRSNYDLFNEIPTRSNQNPFAVAAHDVTSDLVQRTMDSNGSLSPMGDTLRQLRGNSLPSQLKSKDFTPGNHDDKAQPSSLVPVPDRTEAVKIDSRWDFLSLLNSGADSHNSDEEVRINAARTALQAFGVSGTSGRRWMTAPLSSALETIREDDDSDAVDKAPKHEEMEHATSIQRRGKSRKEEDSLDTELVVRQTKSSVKQMRVPKVKKSSTLTDNPKPVAEDTPSSGPSSPVKSLPGTEDEIVDAGIAFLDVIGKSLGYSSSGKDMSGEERRVGHTHHRKTRSQCSIDWTLPLDEFVDVSVPSEVKVEHVVNDEPPSERDESMFALSKERENTVELPNFIDRFLFQFVNSANGEGRWFPYSYEIIIFQWVALLAEQRTSGDHGNFMGSETLGPISGDHQYLLNDPHKVLADAAFRTKGVAISCAPVLFEIIKQSLGWRIQHFFNEARSVSSLRCPPLVSVDASMLVCLERLVSMITDTIIDNRNFDSRELRQTSIDVNDAVAIFLRDLFGLLETKSVHRLVLVYLSRFVVKEGKQWQDRDSKIGLRCSWEISKLRLNAITLFMRLPDFSRVNSPQMNNWGVWWLSAPTNGARTFFDSVVDHFQSLQLPGFVESDGPLRRTQIELPLMRPHWLAELVVDVCLSGIEHAEPSIQHRASSLLHELFWSQSQEGMSGGTSSVLASMHSTFLLKILGQLSYLASFPSKSQLRKDVLPCVVFFVQSAPIGLLRAIWRKLIIRAAGKGNDPRFGVTMEAYGNGALEEQIIQEQFWRASTHSDESQEPNILDMFCLLNLILSTLEYEGSDDHVESAQTGEGDDLLALWQKEFLPAVEHQNRKLLPLRFPEFQVGASTSHGQDDPTIYGSSSSRKWHAHDGAIVVINCGRQIVRETLVGFKPSNSLNQSLRRTDFLDKIRMNSPTAMKSSQSNSTVRDLGFSHADTVVFIRAATALYLQALTLRQSDIAYEKALLASVEVVKIFGIKLCLEAIGETLQHWMRVVYILCGARRAEVRVQAMELLALILRLTWDSYGSFFRIRLPLLAVQTQVMERIVATAAARYYRDQRRAGMTIDYFSNGSAEASLAPLWRTLDRLHHQSASQNVAYRSALTRLAEKLKKLYRAYIAAHALSILSRARSPKYLDQTSQNEGETPIESDSFLRATRITIHRITNASAGYSKQFLGFQSTSLPQSSVAHDEAVEDAFLDAADVFSATELPSHRVAWLSRLADFHKSRNKYAEEATCHFHIHMTLKQASRMHRSLWADSPFLPWTDNSSEGIHLDGEGPAGDPENSDIDLDGGPDMQYGSQIDKNDSFRRIFFRVANSVNVEAGDWDIGGMRNLFYGVASLAEYKSTTPWMSLRDMEDRMVEEAEASGDLFQRAGIIESSRFAWSLAAQFYAETSNYWKLAYVYDRLAKTVISRVPPIDTSQQQEVSVPLGRFYRVWFHGGAPDDLLGSEYVFRTAYWVKLDEFGKQLCDVITSIVPEKTPIDLVLDDGRVDESLHRGYTSFGRIGAAHLEPVRIKVTPLRPLVRNAHMIRGLPEWFSRYTDVSFAGAATASASPRLQGLSETRENASMLFENFLGGPSPSHREHARSFSATVFSSGGSFTVGSSSRRISLSRIHENEFSSFGDGELVSVDKFSFLQPINKDRVRGGRDWYRAASGDFGEKSLRVTLLQVGQYFPACVSRQAVVSRTVFKQSPIEAGVDAVCQWCTLLFRTVVATNGMAVLGINNEPGIGNDAAKVVADSIHNSRVKEMGMVLLAKRTRVTEDEGTDLEEYDRLTDEECAKLQVKLARCIVVYLELLHLLIARNRDLLLNLIQERKKVEGGSSVAGSVTRNTIGGKETINQVGAETWRRLQRKSLHSKLESSSSLGARSNEGVRTSRSMNDDNTLRKTPDDRKFGKYYSEDVGISTASGLGAGGGSGKTDAAIAVQSELQRAFIALTRSIYPVVSGILGSETPRWLKHSCQDSYFSSYAYRHTKIPIGEELCFFAGEDLNSQNVVPEKDDSGGGDIPLTSANPDISGGNYQPSEHSPVGSIDTSSAVSRGSEVYTQRSFQAKSSPSESVSLVQI